MSGLKFLSFSWIGSKMSSTTSLESVGLGAHKGASKGVSGSKNWRFRSSQSVPGLRLCPLEVSGVFGKSVTIQWGLGCEN